MSKFESPIGNAFKTVPTQRGSIPGVRMLVLLVAFIVGGFLISSLPVHAQDMSSDGNGNDLAPLWSADMTVVEYTEIAIGAASADLFSNIGGSENLQIKSLWSYLPDRDLRLAFTDGVPDAADMTLKVGDLELEFPAGSSGEGSFKWTGVDVDWKDGDTVAVSIVRTSTLTEPEDNTHATGGPTVTGTPQVDQTLTADTSSITDQDGLDDVSYEYQWIRSDNGADSEIAGATEASHTLVFADQGKTIKVKVTFTDDAENEETLTSEATGTVEAAPNRAATGDPTISGTPQVSQVLTAGTAAIRDEDGLDGVSYEYQWMAGETDIPDATEATYTPSTEDVGKTIKVKVSFTDDRNNEETLTSAATVAVVAAPNREATGQPTIDGTAQVGETLTANTANVADEDGLTNVSYIYQWIRSDNGTDADIAGQTDSTYTLVAADLGKTIKVKVTFTDDAENAESLTSVATVEVAAKPNTAPTGLPTITGTPQVEQTLTADTSAIADEDGLAGVSYSYQWTRNDGNNDTDIEEATDPSYTLVAADVGRTIKVRISFTDDADYEETLTSAATVPVAAAPNREATGAPTISGTPKVGETLTVSTSGIADEDGLDGVSYSYQWTANDVNGDTEIADATDLTYTPSASDVGKTIKVRVTFTDDAENQETLTSTATAAVAATVPGAPQDVQVSPVGASQALDVTWEAPANDGGSAVTGYKVQWKSGEEDYDASREATVSIRPSWVESWWYQITGLTNGSVYTIRVIATNSAGDGLPSTEVSDTPLSDPDRLRRFIAVDVVEAHESSHPWLRTTWEYMKSEVELQVHYSRMPSGQVSIVCSYDDGLQKCRSESMKIAEGTVDSLSVLIHEMAHVFSLTNGLVDEPAPLGAAYLYFDSLAIASESHAFCRPSELFADILQLSVVGVVSGYWSFCNRDYEGGHADPLTEEALTVVRSALSGQMPQWFVDTYHDSNGIADLEQLWSDVKSMEWWKGGRTVVAYRLRDQFGGYCGNPQVAAVLDIVGHSERESDDEIRNPWRDGGCVPEAPGSLRVVSSNNQLELSWEAPIDDGGSRLRGYIVEWKSGDEDYDESRRAVLDDPSSHSHTVTGLTEGVEHMLRVTAFNVFGDGEYVAVTLSNSPATGLPTISGTARVGETLTASTSGIADEDGLSNPTYSYRWIRNDGAADSYIQDATSSTHRLTDDDVGKTIKVRVSFTDDEGNSESLTSDATAVVAATVPGVPEHVRVTPHDSQALDVSWEAPASDGGSDVTGYRVQWKEATGTWDTPEDVSEAIVTGSTHTIPGLTEGTTYSVRVLASNEVGDGTASAEQAGTPRETTPPSLSTATVNGAILTLAYDEALDENSVPASETFSVTAGDVTTTVDSVSISDISVTLTLSSAVTTDVAVTVSYAVPTGLTTARIKDLAGNAAPALSSQAVVNHTGQSADYNSAQWSATMTVGVSGGLYGYESFYFKMGALSDRTITLDGSVYTLYSLGYYSSNTGSLTVFLDQALSSGFLLLLDGVEFASDDASTLNGATGYYYSWSRVDLNWSNGEEVNVSLVLMDEEEQAENTRSTGLPTITGTAQVSQTLTALTNGISDTDGLDNVDYSFQWLADDTDIAGATDSTYTPAVSDVGKTIKVRVTFTDDADNDETLTSEATVAVAATVPTAPQSLTVTSGRQTQELDVSWQAPSSNGGSVVTGYKVQWKEASDSWDTASEVSEATEAGTTRTITGLTDGTEYSVRVSAMNGVGEGPVSADVSGIPQPAAIWSATLTVGSAEKFVGYTTFVLGSESPIRGALSSDTITLDDVIYTVKALGVLDGTLILSVTPKLDTRFVLVAGTDEFKSGGASTKQSDSVLQFRWDDPGLDWSEGEAVHVKIREPDANTPPTGAPTIIGTPQVDETLTADTSAIGDEDGIDDVEFSYQWLADDTDIDGATSSTYALTTNEQGKTIAVRVSFTDDAENEETLTSEATGTVMAAPNRAATGDPTISGTPQVNQVLTAGTAAISDEDGLDGVSYEYQWLAGETDIDDATEATYTPSTEDVGKAIKVKVSFTDDRNNAETLTSAATVAVVATVPTAPQNLTVTSGSQTQELDASWQAPESNGGSAVTGYKVQWKESTDSWDTEADVSEATVTGTTHTITGLTEDVEYAVRVVATNDVGDGPASTEVKGTPRETTPPELVTAVVDGATLTLTYNEALDANSAPAAEAFAVMVAGTATTVDAVSISGSAVALTLAQAATAEDTVTVSYTAPADAAASRIRDLAGNAAPPLSGREATNNTAGTTEDEEFTTPNAPTGLSVSALNEGMRLSWTVPEDSTVTGYQILRQRPYECEPTLMIHVADTGTTATTFIDPDLDRNVRYTYRVKAINGDKIGSWSNFATSLYFAPKHVTQPNTPAAPHSLESVSTRGGIELTWEPPNGEDDIVGYRILRQRQEECEKSYRVHVENTGSTATTFVDEDVEVGTKYTYRVKAINAEGHGVWSGYTSTRRGLVEVIMITSQDHLSITKGTKTQFQVSASHLPRDNDPSTVDYILRGDVTETEGGANVDGCEDANLGTDISISVVDSVSVQYGGTFGGPGCTAGNYTVTYVVTEADTDNRLAGTVFYYDVKSSLDVGSLLPNREATGLPTISGTAQVDQTLTADISPIDDSDGLENVTYKYQWIRSDNGADTDIAGETDSTYTPSPSDVGKTIKVKVTFTDDADNEETLTSAPTDAVAAAANNLATGAPTISGTPQVEQTLTADTSSITDEDGLTNVSYRYQWIAGGSDIDGANASTYTLTASEQGQTIQVRVTFTDAADNEETLTSAATVAAAAAPNREATGLPTISGTPQVEETLTSDTSAIDDADGLTKVSYKYQWIAGGTDIDGATGSTYALTYSEQGKTIQVRVTFTDDADNTETLTSEATVVVAAAPNREATGKPGIDGTPQVEETLTADTSPIDDEDGLTNVSYEYQWLAGGTDIAGATGSTYELTSSEEGKTIQVRVTFTDDRGNEETLISVATAVVAAAPEPLTVRLKVAAPTSHDGSSEFTFEIEFSEEFGLSYRTLKFDAINVTGGSVERAQRTDKPSNIHWRITIKPQGNGDVTIELPATTDCNAEGAICATDGRKLSNSLSLTVSGPGQ